MSYETISVRMNRSDNSIRWGFTLSKSGDRITIQNVEHDSLSDKAGLRNGDFVESVCGRPAQNLGISEANQIVDQARFEVYFTLQRYVTSHSCLPWTLNEKDNKLVVDQVYPGYGSGFTHNAFSSSNNQNRGMTSAAPFNTSSNYSSSQQYSSSTQNSSSYSSSGVPRVHNIVQQNAPFSSSNQQTPLNKGYNISNYTSGTTYSSKNDNINNTSTPFSSNYSTAPSTGFSSSKPTSKNHTVKFSDNTFANNNGNSTTGINNKPSPFGQGNGSVRNGGLSPNYAAAGGVPLNQQTFVQTSYPLDTSNLRPSSRNSLSPGGSKIRYTSPSSRSRRDLSPNSSVQHLQYNSPMNLYSCDNVAEQYTMQTGKQLEGQRSQNNTPAYLNSETKKYIEEVEGRMHRGLSPSCQSSSFKRISQAVGAPCK